MCGICGFTKATGTEANLATLQKMCEVMAHRGPDGEGHRIADGVAFGHRRLSLIDLEGGAQPLVRDEGDGMRWSIAFNGEIYNYRELRAELEQLGFSFNTNSDTEVLLVGYIAWGENVLSRLRGMFAFAIHDARTRELFCARDFFGIKPFYYTVQRGQFIFASEIKSILEHPAYERQLNEEALAQYLCFQFSALPETFFKGVFKLLPGHYLRVRDDAPLQCVRYWRPDFRSDASRAAAETVDLIEEAMRESVRYHNVADVEVGSFLSSGIDSSYLAACLARENPDVKTFTVGFAEYEGERDEVSWARELAGQLGVENDAHHITEDEYWESLPRVQWHMDEPSGDPSAVALFFVDKLAARRVKAVLSGEGADEFFGGYRIYQTPFANEHVNRVPKGVLRAGSKVLHAMGQRGANYLERASEQVEEWYYTNANGVAFTPAERNRLLAPALRDRLGSLPAPQQLTAAAYAEAAGLDDTTRMQYVDLQFWLVGDILLKTDKMAMAHSLESRVPFLDRKVFALASTIPTSQKVNERQTKVALREAAERAVPHEWAQKEKLGFPVPVASWLREDRYFKEVKRTFESDEAARFFNVAELRRLLDEHRAGADRSRRIWIVYSFLIWYRVFFVDRTLLGAQ
ncbi:MAG: asparagine synthase (glutamine-hydrolyzing) [Eggerthellaceae bacterium]|nr:asparagine synthase (glutamine-hydrolyzing) [Eggerthellaceae bacterium]